MNPFYENYFKPEAFEVGNFGHSWLMAQEIIDYDWQGQFVTQKAYVKNQYASLFRKGEPFPVNFPRESLYFIIPNYQQEPDTTEVCWVTSYREYVGCSESLIEQLLNLGSPDQVRVVFWFDS
ncbi:MAG: hypothetical protein WBB28_03585 [Crinalium sp.]